MEGFPVKLLTYKTAAEYLDCSPSKVQKMCLAGELPILKVGNETRIRQEDLEAWVAGQVHFNKPENCRDSNTSEPLPTTPLALLSGGIQWLSGVGYAVHRGGDGIIYHTDSTKTIPIRNGLQVSRCYNSVNCRDSLFSRLFSSLGFQFRFTTHHFVEQFFTSHRSRNAGRARVYVSLADFDVAVAHRFLDFVGSGAGFGEARSERVPAGVRHEFFWPSLFFSEFCVDTVQSGPVQVSLEPTWEQPFGIRPQLFKQSNGVLGALRQPQSPDGILRLSAPDRNDRISDIRLLQAQRLFRSKSQVEHQNRGMVEWVYRRGQVLFLKLAIEHELSSRLAWQQPDFRNTLDQSPFLSQAKSLAKSGEFPVDRDNTDRFLRIRSAALRQAPVGKVHDHRFVNLSQSRGLKKSEVEQAARLCLVETHSHRLLGIVLPDVIEKPSFHELLERRRFLWRGDAQTLKRSSRSDRGFRKFRLVDVRLVGRALEALSFENEIVVPVLASFGKCQDSAPSSSDAFIFLASRSGVVGGRKLYANLNRFSKFSEFGFAVQRRSGIRGLRHSGVRNVNVNAKSERCLMRCPEPRVRPLVSVSSPTTAKNLQHHSLESCLNLRNNYPFRSGKKLNVFSLNSETGSDECLGQSFSLIEVYR